MLLDRLGVTGNDTFRPNRIGNDGLPQFVEVASWLACHVDDPTPGGHADGRVIRTQTRCGPGPCPGKQVSHGAAEPARRIAATCPR
jgi:hypothetical protein